MSLSNPIAGGPPAAYEPFGFRAIFRRFLPRILVTWGLVLVETTLIALIPLFIGQTIDGLLANSFSALITLASVLAGLAVVAVLRRMYDTRVYSHIRLHIGQQLSERHGHLAVSIRSARLTMLQELVHFLEMDVPALIGAIVQIGVGFAMLLWFGVGLGVAAGIVLFAMVGLYGFFHRGFYRLNGVLNAETERRVAVLDAGRRLGVFRHLRALRKTEVSLSDREAFLYGGIFTLQVGFILVNLVQAAGLPGITAGAIFAIATYSWDFVEAALHLPMVLQGWSRLSEITHRINGTQAA